MFLVSKESPYKKLQFQVEFLKIGQQFVILEQK